MRKSGTCSLNGIRASFCDIPLPAEQQYTTRVIEGNLLWTKAGILPIIMHLAITHNSAGWDKVFGYICLPTL